MDDSHASKLQSLLKDLNSDNTFEQLELISKQAPDTNFSYSCNTFGWAPALTHLQSAASRLGLHSQLQQSLLSTDIPQSQQPVNADHYAQKSLPQVLAASSEASAPHSAAEIVDACGLSRIHESLRASAILGLPDDQHVDLLRAAIKQHINGGWSQEAVRQGVRHAKSGNYVEAKRCYDKAIELQPDNADAFVARGAAFANEQNLVDAAADLEKALQLDPANANAIKYIAAVKSKAEQQGISLARPVANDATIPSILPEVQPDKQGVQAVDVAACQHAKDMRHDEASKGFESSQKNRGHKRHRIDDFDRHAANHNTERQLDSRGQHVREQKAASDSSDGSSQGTTSTSTDDDGGDDGRSASTLKSALHEVLKARSKSSKRKHRSGDKKRKHGRHKHKDKKGKKRKRHR